MNSKNLKKYYTRLQQLPKLFRQILGGLLLLFGILGFLPVVGFWMIPLGLMVLAIDFPWAKRLLTKLKFHYRRLSRKFRDRKNSPNDPK